MDKPSFEKPLQGKKVGILVESQFIPGEIDAYQFGFEVLGAEVVFMSRLWDQPSMTFYSTVEPGVTAISPSYLQVNIDFGNVKLEDFAAIIMVANYCSVRLRWFTPPKGQQQIPSGGMVASAPAVQFFAKAMANPKIIKGALCHGLWILTPRPDLLRGRKVICNEVVLADVMNAGGVFQWDTSGVVIDGDLVTGHDWHVVGTFIAKIAEAIVALGP
jgi:protease I